MRGSSFTHGVAPTPCSYWDGAVLPMGLGLSLVINGIFIARHINKVHVMRIRRVVLDSAWIVLVYMCICAFHTKKNKP